MEEKASGYHHMHHYRQLAIMVAFSFVAMFVLMYAMVDVFANIYPNLNQAYMAGFMAAPMAVIELALMGKMYGNKRLNAVIAGVSVLALAGFFVLIRQQTVISDRQFLKSMIPHHASAILMCREAPIRDAQIKDLCRRIIQNQQAEIDEMKARLRALDGG